MSDTSLTSNQLSKYLAHLAGCTRGALRGAESASMRITLKDSEAIQTAADLLSATHEPPAGPYTIEPHGDGFALYRGRDQSHHGWNLARITETTPDVLRLIEGALNRDLRASEPPGNALVCIGQLIQLDDGLGTVFADWNEERFKLEPGTKLYAQRTSETKSVSVTIVDPYGVRTPAQWPVETSPDPLDIPDFLRNQENLRAERDAGETSGSDGNA